MTTINRYPAQLVLTKGKLQSRNTEEMPAPKTIHYTHTVRMIDSNIYEHDNEVDVIKKQYNR